ncbi:MULTISPECIES: HD domain-containing protein [Romboutsia]|uniref:HDIG domain protein n=1 Tax=Romboutsia hominis TaxID=1507512 RepID=A0A2P2BM92_9FIRM|nr:MULTISPECIES: HD domain-containing protein [Romboutsia]MCH1958760.1 HD domain-containing protein [Romboutsia hominis]MCH1970676.1 HD domain-containing protein [Romboutsia hominis]MDB8805996.1 HD domain-containing protein [Romboutsia sp. 1001216sp1]MDB8808432.1 HD domain-containing protein [Romboutsia sp. 1001216sp1]MDB8811673.1 HD domain-containing protein [Romboutsia sp. 1001216sp1]
MEIKDMLLESLVFENTSEKFKELDRLKKLEKVILKLNGMKEVGECKFHVVNVYEHSIKALEEFEEMLKEGEFFSSHLRNNIKEYLNEDMDGHIKKIHLLKLSIFLHDIGKADSKTVDDTGRVHFRGHEIVGAKISRELGKSLNLDERSIELIEKYVRYHMVLLALYKKNDMSKENLTELFDILGKDCIGVFILGYCDIVATRKLLNPNEDMNIIKVYMEYALTNYIYRYKQSS